MAIDVDKSNYTPRFSIVIPVYNAETHLRNCLQSVSSQDYTNYEVIIVDDGSTDNSTSICKSFFMQSTIKGKFIRQCNSGPLVARQVGYAAASGEYVIHIDSDDEIRESALTQLAKAITATKADIVLFDYTYRKPFGDVSKEKRFRIEPYNTRVYTRGEFLSLYAQGQGVYLWEKAVKRELLFPKIDKVYNKLRFEEDNLQTCLIYDRAQSLVYVPMELYYHRKHLNGLDGVFDIARFRDHCFVRSTIREYVHRWDKVFPGSRIERDYIASSLKWIIYRSVKRMEDEELITEIVSSEDFQSIISYPDSLKELSISERFLLEALKRKYRPILAMAMKAKSLRNKLRSFCTQAVG